jgi:hypothetical protein
MVHIEMIIGQKIYFTVPFEKIENMEILKDMLAEMNAKMDATQERMDANTKAMQERIQDKMKGMMARQIGSLVSIMVVSRETDRVEMKQEIRAGQEHIKEIMPTEAENLDAEIGADP